MGRDLGSHDRAEDLGPAVDVQAKVAAFGEVLLAACSQRPLDALAMAADAIGARQRARIAAQLAAD